MMLMTKSFRTLVATAALAMMAGGAQAATCNTSTLPHPTNNVTYTATQGTPDALTSPMCRAGNDKNTLGGEGWIPGDATDEASNGVTLTLTGQNWTIENTGNYATLLFVLKQSNSFATFVVDMTKPLTGTWGTLGPDNDNGKGEPTVNGLSHASVWRTNATLPPPPPPPAIPLPAGGWLMLAGFGALAALRCRRKA